MAIACAAIPRRPVNPSSSVVVALTLTRAGDAEQLGDAVAHCLAVLPIFGRSQIGVTSTLTTPPPACPPAPLRAAGTARTARRASAGRWARSGCRCRRADRAEERVGQRVQAHVRVGMAEQGLIMRHRHPAQHHLVAVAEPMHVEAETGAGLGPARQQPLAAAKIALPWSLSDCPRRPTYHRDGVFGDGRVVGQRQPGAAPVCLQNKRKTKALRRLSRHEPARSTVAATVGGPVPVEAWARFSVSAISSAGMAPSRSSSARSPDRGCRCLRTGGRRRGSARRGCHVDEAFETIQHRLTRGAAQYRRQRRQIADGLRSSPCRPCA